MQPRDIFLNDFGRFRSGWRFTLYLCALLVMSSFADILLSVIYRLVERTPEGWTGRIIEIGFRLLLFAIAILAGWLCGRLLESLPLRALGWALHKGFLRDLLVGCLIGGLTLVLAVGLAVASGGMSFTFSGTGTAGAIVKTILLSGVVFMFAAAAEEVMFRGYGLQTFTRARLAWLGILLTSVPFAAVHLGNPNISNKGIIFTNTALAGVWLAVAYLKTRSLWFPLGVHFAWNWVMAAFFGIPVSGITELTPNPLLNAHEAGPVWLTGGKYGIEAGIACTVALLASTVFLWRTKLLSPTAEMWELTSHEIPKGAKPADTTATPEEQTPETNQPPVATAHWTADD